LCLGLGEGGEVTGTREHSGGRVNQAEGCHAQGGLGRSLKCLLPKFEGIVKPGAAGGGFLQGLPLGSVAADGGLVGGETGRGLVLPATMPSCKFQHNC
jgi:hypothetical protein